MLRSIKKFTLFCGPMLAIFLFSCSKNDCDYIGYTEAYNDSDDFEKYSLRGVYKVSKSLNTDHTYSDKELLESSIYILIDSSRKEKYRIPGYVYVHQYPFWDNRDNIARLGNFYG